VWVSHFERNSVGSNYSTEYMVPFQIEPVGAKAIDAPPPRAAAEPEPRSPTLTPAPSFAELFARYADYVPALLRRLGVAPAEVPDLSQDVFSVVHEKLPGFRGDSSTKTWLCGICLRVASNHRRRAWVRRLVFFGDLDQHAAAEEPFDRLELRQRVAMLDAALRRLPARQREVFVLFEVEELSVSEIARLLQCPEKTAYTRLYAARRAMTRQLTRCAAKASFK
jgi:RNA polymerase sigma-70 factor, ECF subfamily